MRIHAAFALNPTRLRLCGDEGDDKVLVKYLSGDLAELPKVRGILGNIGEYPHLNAWSRAIARTIGEGDQFSEKVEEIYWLGGNLTISKQVLMEEYEPCIRKWFKDTGKPGPPELMIEAYRRQLPDMIPASHMAQVIFIIAADHEPVNMPPLINKCMISGAEVQEVNEEDITVKQSVLDWSEEKGLFYFKEITQKIKINKEIPNQNYAVHDLVVIHHDLVVMGLEKEQMKTLVENNQIAVDVLNTFLDKSDL